MASELLPAVDPGGLPGPVGLFHLLLVLTFFLHLLFVNLTLGGTLIAWISHLRSARREDDPHGVLAHRMTAVNGYGISLTITTGVAPLLFIQTLYQQLFYAGTILIGWAWFSLLVLLLIGYYAAYLYKFRGAPARGAGGGVWIALAAIGFLAVAAIHVAVHLVHVRPGLWASYDLRPWAVLGDPTFVPRLLHFVLAGVAMSGIVMTWWSVRRARRGQAVELEGSIARIGWRWALWATVAQVVDGVILLVLLPGDVLAGLMRGGPAALAPLALAVIGAVGLLVMLARITDPVEAPAGVTGLALTMVAVIAVMAITRHQVRLLYIEGDVALGQLAVSPQWLNLGLFAVLLVVALAVTGWMVRLVLTSPADGADAA
jgi:hypothetical protein